MSDLGGLTGDLTKLGVPEGIGNVGGIEYNGDVKTSSFSAAGSVLSGDLTKLGLPRGIGNVHRVGRYEEKTIFYAPINQNLAGLDTDEYVLKINE